MAMSQSEREELLKRWIQRSSDSEEERIERAERMITKAIEAHAPFDGHRSSFVAQDAQDQLRDARRGTERPRAALDEGASTATVRKVF